MILSDLWKNYNPISNIKRGYQNASQDFNKVKNFVKQQPSNFSVGMNTYSQANKPTQFAGGMLHGLGQAGVSAGKFVNRAVQNPVVNVLNPSTLVSKKFAPQNTTRLENYQTGLNKVAPTTTTGKVGSFVGEQLPYLTIPMGGKVDFGTQALKGLAKVAPDVITAAKLAQAARTAKWAEVGLNAGKNALIGAGFGGAQSYGEGGNVKGVLKSAGMGAATAAGLGLAGEGVSAVVGKIGDKIKLAKAVRSIKDPAQREAAILKTEFAPGFAKLPGTPPLSNEAKNIEPLIKEAKKYKTPDEFVKAKQDVFHGTMSKGLKVEDKPIFLTKDFDEANTYAGYSYNQKPEGEVLGFHAKNGKSLDLNKTENVKKTFQEMYGNPKLKKAYDSVPDRYEYLKENSWGETEPDVLLPKQSREDFETWLQLEYQKSPKIMGGRKVDTGSYSFGKETQGARGELLDAYNAYGNPTRQSVYNRWDEIIAHAKKKGYDFIDHTTESPDASILFPERIAISPKKSLIGKDELTKVWNQAHSTPPLSNEAKAQQEFKTNFDKTYNSGPSKVKMTTALDKEKVANQLQRERSAYIQSKVGEPKSYSTQDINEYNAKVIQAGKEFDSRLSPQSTPPLSNEAIPKGISKAPLTPKNATEGVVQAPAGQTGVNIDPVQKIVSALKEAKPLRKEQNILNSELRKQQYAKLMNTRKTATGEQGYFKELGALKGGAKKVDFSPIRQQLTQPDIDSLFNKINDSNIGDWEKINAKSGLMKLLTKEGASMPTGGELKLMNDVFGSDMTKAILGNRTGWQKFIEGAGEVLNLPRALMASFDLSAPFRQGAVMISRPKQFFPAFASMFKQAGSEKAFRAVQQDISARPTYNLMRESKLALTDIGGDLAGREEMFMSNLGEKIPVLKYGIKASNRAYTGFLNKLRADVFDDLVSKSKLLGNDNPNVAEDIAKFVNAATGRGDLGSLNKTAPVLNSIFFSPRLMAGRVNMLNPAFYAKLDPMVRKEAVKSMLVFGATATTALGLAKAGGAEVGTDPKSADFGKIKVGDTRYDILGGFQQYIVLASRLISGKMTSSTTGKEMSLTEGYKPTTRFDIIVNFLKSKENPILSYMTGFLDKTNQMNQEFNPTAEAINRFIPMFAQDIVDLTADKGFAKAIGMEVPSAFGVGVQTYGKQIPVMGTTPSGSSTIKWRNPYDIGETIYNKVTGKVGSPFSKEEQISLDQTRRKEAQTKADVSTVVADVTKKINKGQTIKGVTNLPDGRGLYVTDEGIKYAKTPEKAQQELDKIEFDKSGKKTEIKNGTYYYRDKNGDPKDMSESEYTDKINTQKMDLAYNNKDYKTWISLANEQLKSLDKQYSEADDLTKLDIQNKAEDLVAKIKKYQGYGGFKKGSVKKPKWNATIGKISLTKAKLGKVKKPKILSIKKVKKPRLS